MQLVKLSFLAALVLSIGAGCAASNDEPEEKAEAAESDLTRTLSDNAIKGKLRGVLNGITFTSEADYEYVVFEGDKVSGSTLDEATVRAKLREAAKANNSSERDILPSSCRARELDVAEAIADGDAADAALESDPEDSYARHDRQVGIALKVMRSQLKSVVGFTFGTNASGDMDDVGTVLYVYVGISKTTGKLIAIMTEAVYT